MVRRTRAAAGQLDEQSRRMAQAIADEVFERMSGSGFNFNAKEVTVRVWSEKTTVYATPPDDDDDPAVVDGEVVMRGRGAKNRVQHRGRKPRS